MVWKRTYRRCVSVWRCRWPRVVVCAANPDVWCEGQDSQRSEEQPGLWWSFGYNFPIYPHSTSNLESVKQFYECMVNGIYIFQYIYILEYIYVCAMIEINNTTFYTYRLYYYELINISETIYIRLYYWLSVSKNDNIKLIGIFLIYE